MKRLFIILSIVSALFFTNCDNENITTPEPLGTVTINGAIISDLNELESDSEPMLEKIPAGVSLYAFNDANGALLATTATTVTGYSIEYTEVRFVEVSEGM